VRFDSKKIPTHYWVGIFYSTTNKFLDEKSLEFTRLINRERYR
jgi:hypothetical protein